MDFKTYLLKLEAMVVKGLGTTYTTQTKFWVKDGKFFIPELLGDIDTELSVIIAYYGHIRKSRGFRNQTGKEEKRECFIIQFNQIKFQDILKLEPTLINDFIEFKQQLVNMRWGTNGQTIG